MTTATQRYFYIIFALMFAVGMHYFHNNFGGVGLELPFNLVVWCFVSILIGLGLWQTQTNNIVIKSKLLIYSTIFSITLFFPLLYVNNELAIYSTQRLVGLLAGLAFLFSIYQLNFSASSREKLIVWILIGVIIEAVLGFFQQYILTTNNWFNYNPEISPPFGIFQQPNVMSTFMVMGLALSAYLLSSAKEGNTSQRLLMLTSLLASYMVILNGSRTATISLFVLLVGTAPFLFKKAQKNHLQQWYASILLGISIPLIISFFYSTDLPTKGIVDFNRLHIYTTSLSVLYENLLFGTGYGSFDVVFQHSQVGNINNIKPGFIFPTNTAHPHNEILLWGIEGGLLPIIAALTLFTAMLHRYFKKGWRIGLFCVAIIFPAAFHSMTELPFYHSAIVWITFLFTLYVLEAKFFDMESLSLPRFIKLKIASLAIPAITISYMLTGLYTFHCVENFVKSEYRQRAFLTNIINPTPLLPMVEYQLYLLPLLKSNDIESTEYFISKTKKLIKHSPRDTYYHGLIQAYIKLRDYEHYLETYNEGKMIFPQSIYFQNAPMTRPSK
ncbi:PglL family O-oligosaccharyltransferase [Shewanella spartinae]|uniref:PglL family O-oligosaccharyltransferase n=1 Tax=Shewanella spartinae TaxID=2864205 RepID=UPI001C65B9F6|nr:Wzy polymerase domain-containing protein [Shewanella spartinae]QYJ93410.1 Wzy polymerase domain-containing protein [Shewanella spartinae]